MMYSNTPLYVKNKLRFMYLLLFFWLLSTPLMYADPGFGTDNDPGEPANPIDTPYFWALLFLLGVYIAYKKLQPKTT